MKKIDLKKYVRPTLILLWFKLVWGIAVFGQSQYEWLLIVLICAFIAYLGKPLQELKFCLSGAAIGIGVDSLLSVSGMYQYLSTQTLPIPLWHMCIWVALALILRHAMRFLLSKIVLASILGAIFGPFAYFVAMLQGAVSFPYGNQSTALVLVASWFFCSFSIIFLFNLLELDSSKARFTYIGSFTRLITNKNQ